tara:strand:- start:537 stop:686 length:150 start_codon:yes stop_codon:yes gene_type:complete
MVHKVYDQNKKLVFKGEPDEVYEYFLKLMSGNDKDCKIKYENYLKYKKK